MDTITVRRWVAADPPAVWAHLFDLERLAVEDPHLDLETFVLDDAGPTVPPVGTHATVRRRHGLRLERVELEVEDRVEPSHLAIAVSVHGELWRVTVDVTALGAGGSDVRFHAERDPIGVVPRRQRGAHEVGLLLDGLARQLDRTLDLVPA